MSASPVTVPRIMTHARVEELVSMPASELTLKTLRPYLDFAKQLPFELGPLHPHLGAIGWTLGRTEDYLWILAQLDESPPDYVHPRFVLLQRARLASKKAKVTTNDVLRVLLCAMLDPWHSTNSSSGPRRPFSILFDGGYVDYNHFPNGPPPGCGSTRLFSTEVAAELSRMLREGPLQIPAEGLKASWKSRLDPGSLFSTFHFPYHSLEVGSEWWFENWYRTEMRMPLCPLAAGGFPSALWMVHVGGGELEPHPNDGQLMGKSFRQFSGKQAVRVRESAEQHMRRALLYLMCNPVYQGAIVPLVPTGADMAGGGEATRKERLCDDLLEALTALPHKQCYWSVCVVFERADEPELIVRGCPRGEKLKSSTILMRHPIRLFFAGKAPVSSSTTPVDSGLPSFSRWHSVSRELEALAAASPCRMRSFSRIAGTRGGPELADPHCETSPVSTFH